MQMRFSSKFKKDFRKIATQGKDLSKLENIISLLVNEKQLPKELLDHALKGNWNDYRELHIEPDWLLIYQIENNTVILARTGSHSELF